MKKINDINKIIISILLLFFSFCLIFTEKIISAQQPLSKNLAGRILIQVEQNGEAWYVSPIDEKRYYLGRPADAFNLMRGLGLGITNADIAKIPVAEENFLGNIDSDGDGLSDMIEDAFGTDKYNPDTDGDGFDDKNEILGGFDPLGPDKLSFSPALINRLKGRIILQIEQNGEAWYVNPVDGKRYFLGRPTDAFNIMRKLGLGITDANLEKISRHYFNPDFLPENIKNKYTEPVRENPNLRKFSGMGKYYLTYPANWKINKFPNEPNSVHFTDAKDNYYTEKKGVIMIDYFTSEKKINDVNIFRIASLNKAKLVTDKKIQINGYDSYENTFEHERTFQKTITIKINSKEFIRASLATTKNNFNYYNSIFQSILNKLEIPE